jgi:hypothetical protein
VPQDGMEFMGFVRAFVIRSIACVS